jgi:autotransporter-associated beta strand protein
MTRSFLYLGRFRLTCLGLLATVGILRAADYYVDPSGNDANTGTSAAAPWQSLAKVNATTFAPGDRILFKRGGSWTGMLYPKGSGDSTAQITLGSYGDGAKPLIDAVGGYAAIHLNSQSYWTIEGFEVTNFGDGDANRSGIRVQASGSQTTQRIRILNNDVRDIRGIRNVNDGARNNGAIFVWIDEPGKADEVLIQGNAVTNVYGQGINFAAEAEYMGGGMNYNNCSPNVVVRGNRVLTTSGDGILLLGTDNELAEYNEVGYVGALSGDNNNIAAAWPTRHVNGVWQYNYVHNTVDRGNDSTAFDNDGFVKGTTYFQYNHTYNNQGGFFMEYQWGGDSNAKSVVRYNISVNESRIVASNRVGALFYNNVFYSPGISFGMEWMGSQFFTFTNNIFWGSGWWDPNAYSSQTFVRNTFWGGTWGPTGSTGSAGRDPLFVNPTTTGNLAGFILQATSPERTTGAVITNNGGKDFWGAPLPVSPTRPHRGASQINAISSYTAAPTYVFVNGPTTGNVPPSGSYNINFSAEVRDGSFRLISSPSVVWSVSPAVSGLSINSNGLLNIASTVPPQRIAVNATSGTVARTWSVNLVNTGTVPLTWNNGVGTGKWNSSDVNWSGNSWIEGAQATFSHTASPQTVTIEGSRSAGSWLVGNGGNNANYTFTSASGGSLAAGSFLIQGNPGNEDTTIPNTLLDSAIINVSGNLGIGRAGLRVKGNSTLTAGTIGGNISGISSADWGYLTIQDSASVTATNGVIGNTTAWGINLNGGMLTTSSIQASDFTYKGAYLHFNGGTLRSSRHAHSFVSLFNGSKAYIGSGGAIIDSNGYDIGIGVILADASSASPASNGGTTLGGTGFLRKLGSGTLTLAAANTYSGATLIEGGKLKLAPVPLTPVAGMARWFDASGLGVSNGAGVSQWNDLSGNNAHATVPSGNGTPTYIGNAGTGTGLGALSFAAGGGATNSQAYQFARDTNARTIFSIFKGSGFLLTDTESYDLHRPGDINPADPLLADYGQINYLGTVRVNGSQVAPLSTAMPTNLYNGYNLVSLTTNGTPIELSTINRDRIYHSGNQSHGEVLIYDTVLSEAQRQANERYLNYKWFGISSGGSSDPILPTSTSVVLSKGGILDIAGIQQTIGSLSASDASGTQVQLGSGTLTVGNATSTTFDGVISGSGGLVKQGSGLLILSGANSYTGSTTVSGGTLQLGNGISPTNLADSADVIVETGAMLALNYTGTDVIDELWVDGNRLPPGIYSSATEFITGTGTLTVSNGPASHSYVTWVGRGGYALAGSPSDDDDKDGIANLLEYVFGGNPIQHMPSFIPISAVEKAGNLVFSFRRSESSTSDTTQTFQYSTDLTNWTDVPLVPGGMVLIQSNTPQNGVDTVTVTVPSSPSSRIFGRLKATVP